MPASPPFSELFSLRGKGAVVTGGGRGIGEAICRRLAEVGAAVAVTDIDLDSAKRTSEAIVKDGGRAVAMKLDVSSPQECGRAIKEAVSSLGGVDVLVNNAGVFPFSPALQISPEAWGRVLSINLSGAFFLARSAAEHMISTGREGSIVNIASVDAIRPTGGLSHYDASKGGLVMLTRSLAFEFGPKKIRVNAIAPGAIDTPGARDATGGSLPTGMNPADVLKAFLARIPLGRMGSPDDIARAAVYLAGPAAGYVTGSLLVVDGGFLVA